MIHDGDIVCFIALNKGRSCESHECCWENLSADDLICFSFCVLDYEYGAKEAIKSVWIWIGTESCLVGFLPRNIVKSRKDTFIDKFSQVFELEENSENRTKQGKSHRNLGMATFCLLEDIPKME